MTIINHNRPIAKSCQHPHPVVNIVTPLVVGIIVEGIIVEGDVSIDLSFF